MITACAIDSASALLKQVRLWVFDTTVEKFVVSCFPFLFFPLMPKVAVHNSKEASAVLARVQSYPPNPAFRNNFHLSLRAVCYLHHR